MEQARQQALEMRDELILGFQKIKDKLYYDDAGKQKRPRDGITPVWISELEGKEWIQEADDFLDYLENGVAETETLYKEILDEVSIVLEREDKSGKPATIDLSTCSKEAFVIHLMRYCIKNGKLPLNLSTNWKRFANYYKKYIMDAI